MATVLQKDMSEAQRLFARLAIRRRTEATDFATLMELVAMTQYGIAGGNQVVSCAWGMLESSEVDLVHVIEAINNFQGDVANMHGLSIEIDGKVYTIEYADEDMISEDATVNESVALLTNS